MPQQYVTHLLILLAVIAVAVFFSRFLGKRKVDTFAVNYDEIVVDPECADMTPVDLIALYSGRPGELATHLSNTALPPEILKDPKRYPMIATILKQMGHLGKCQKQT